MRIAEISTLARPVPPDGEGSVESLVHMLTEKLLDRGHDVTVFATADSETRAKLRSPVEQSYRADATKWDWQLYENYQVQEAFRAWRDFDVIHCHSYHFGLLYCDWVPIPSFHSFHVEPGPDVAFLAARSRNRHLVCCSKYQALGLTDYPPLHIIPHGIDVNKYYVAPEEEREDYLLFLGRFTPGKGPERAMAIARQAGLPLQLAAPPNNYFKEVIRPRLAPDRIEYAGEVHGRKKAALLANARALVYPVQDAEPFGLVLVEAMASGLPVVALRRGAVPEIVEQGVTGWVCDSEQEMPAAIDRVKSFDREKIRRRAVEKFSCERMADDFEILMRHAVEEAGV